MKAAVLRGPDAPFTIEDVYPDALRPTEVLVRIVATGMCHTDLLARDPQLAARLGPVILGHEGSGIVHGIGSAVTGFERGDHVVLSFDSCGACSSCLTGSPAYCREFEARNLSARRRDETTGATSIDGGKIAARWFGQSSFAEFAIATDRNLVKVDRDLPLEKLGPLGCGIQTGAGAVMKEMRLAPGQRIAIFGAGAVGLSALLAAKLSGAAEIVVTDIRQERLDHALELGATRIVRGPSTAAELVSAVTEGDDGMDFTLETTSVPALIEAAVGSLRRPGKAVLVGSGPSALSISPSALAGRTLTFAYEGSAIPQLFIPEMIGLWRRGQFPFDSLIRMYPFEEISLAEADAASGAVVKPVIRIGWYDDAAATVEGV